MAKDTKIIQGNSILENSPPKGPGREGLYLEGTFKNQSRGFYLSRENLSKHLLLLGSTGSGKTNVFYRLLAQIKKTWPGRTSWLSLIVRGTTSGNFTSQETK